MLGLGYQATEKWDVEKLQNDYIKLRYVASLEEKLLTEWDVNNKT